MKKFPKFFLKNMRKMKKPEKAPSNKERVIVPILGIFIDSTSKVRALNRAWKMVTGDYEGDGGRKAKLIVTPNPEIILAGARNRSLEAILNKADLALPDGIGTVMAMRYLGLSAPKNQVLRPIVLVAQGLWVGLNLFINRKWLFEVSEVVPGRWLFEELVRKSAEEGKRVFLLGGKPGVAARAAEVLSNKYEVLSIKGESGPWLNLKGEPVNKPEKGLPAQVGIEKEIIEQINTFKPHFLFVGFGHPKQEKWLARNLAKLDVGVAMTVGGAFDYLAGAVPAPPQWVTVVGFEWLWRLLSQPARFRRIFNAVVVFPLKIYLYKLDSRI